MDVEEEGWLQAALFNFERSKCIFKVSSIQSEEAIPKGYNYGSDVKRLKMKLVLNSGETVERKYIYKTMPKSEIRRKTILQSGVYTTETRMFTEVLPKMEKLRLTKEKDGERFYPECYGIRNMHEAYLLEDLSALEYKQADRYSGLDQDHVVVAIRTLAKYHAIGAKLIELGEIVLRDFDKHYMINDRDNMGVIILDSLEEFAKEIQTSWEEEWQPYVEKIRKFTTDLLDRITDGVTRDENKFNTINHGDFWLANMMFKYSEEGKPIALRMVDFQMCNYNSPMVDFQYLLNTSSKEELVSVEKRAELFDYYCEQLYKNLDSYDYKGRKPTVEELSQEYEKVKYFGAAVALAFMPLMKIPADQVPDMEEISKNWLENKGTKHSSYKNQDKGFQALIRKNLKYAEEIGVL